jgi:hypothetical protein
LGKRTRRRGGGEKQAAESADYTDAEGIVLTLRGTMSAGTRRKYAKVLSGQAGSAGSTREDAWHRAVEFLFERLAVRWVVADVPVEGQKDLLARFRFASAAEREWIRTALREHLAQNFPELEAP